MSQHGKAALISVAAPDSARAWQRWVQTKIEIGRADPRPAFSEAQWQRIRADKLVRSKC